MTDGRKVTGARGESVAAEHLRRQGYRIAAANWRCRAGEIDLIAEDGPSLVFVEVRTRRSTRVGSAEESVTRTKQRRLVALAETYLQWQEAAGRPWIGGWRIDVVAIRLGSRGEVLELNHLINAVEGG